MRVTKRHKPKNQNWGKAMPLTAMYGEQNVCEFDKAVEQLQLTPDQFEQSTVLKAWVKKNYRSRYVPEYLLLLWNLVEWSEDA